MFEPYDESFSRLQIAGVRGEERSRSRKSVSKSERAELLTRKGQYVQIAVLGVFGDCKKSYNLDKAKYPAAVAASHGLLHCGCFWGKGKILRALQEGAQVYGNTGAGGASPVIAGSGLRHSPAIERRSDQRMTQSASTRTPSPSPVRGLRSLQHPYPPLRPGTKY